MSEQPVIRQLWIGVGLKQYMVDSALAQAAMQALDAVPPDTYYLGHYVRVNLPKQNMALFTRETYADRWRMEFLGTEADCLAYWPMKEHPGLVQQALHFAALLKPETLKAVAEAERQAQAAQRKQWKHEQQARQTGILVEG